MKFQRKSIYQQYFLLSISISFLILLIIILVTITDYRLFKGDKKYIYAQEAGKIVSDIEKNFMFIEEFSKIIGEKIASYARADSTIIGDIFIKNLPIARVNKDILMISLFDFVTPSGKIIASTIEGAIVNQPVVDKDKRSWMKLAPEEPWKLHISLPDKAIININQKEDFGIPIGFGITDKQGNFLGTISTGISSEKLYSKIRNSLRHNISFIILTKDLKLLSDYNEISMNLPKEINYNNLVEIEEGLLPKPIKYQNQIYAYFKNIENTPYIILVGEDKIALNNEFNNRVVPHIIQIILIGGLLFILFYNFRKRIINPIIDLSKITHEISIGCEYLQIPDYKISEINLLADHLKQVAEYMMELKSTKEKLQLTQNELKIFNQELEKKVELRTHELEQALEAKTEFLNNISHEIRTPIQGVRGTVDGLVTHWNELSEDKKYEYAKLVLYSADRLSKLVGNLLDLSKLSNGKILLDLRQVNLSSQILDIIEECKLLYLNDKKIEFLFDSIENSYIYADSERISQVLRNLFVNAIKFSPDNSVVRAKISSSKIIYDDNDSLDAIHFSLIDQAIGIPEDEIESIFMPFAQSSKTKTKAGGTGLGLSICREIINAHHGRIWAENYKNGAIFHFIIPIIQDKQMEGQIIKFEDNIEFDAQLETIDATILIIDDEEICLSGMELILFGTNYKLIKAENGHNGLDYLTNHKVDLILLDLMMPDMYGLNVLYEIKSRPDLVDIPVILQTGSSDEAEIKKAYNLGISSYIKKPYNKKIVKEEILKMLRKITS